MREWVTESIKFPKLKPQWETKSIKLSGMKRLRALIDFVRISMHRVIFNLLKVSKEESFTFCPGGPAWPSGPLWPIPGSPLTHKTHVYTKRPDISHISLLQSQSCRPQLRCWDMLPSAPFHRFPPEKYHTIALISYHQLRVYVHHCFSNYQNK